MRAATPIKTQTLRKRRLSHHTSNLNSIQTQQQQQQQQLHQQLLSQESPIVVLLPLLGGPQPPHVVNDSSSTSSSNSNSQQSTSSSSNTQQQQVTATDTYSSSSSSSSSGAYSSSGVEAASSTGNASSAREASFLGLDVWTYVGCLGVALLAFLVFLVLPKGVRKAYCRSERRRYTRRYHHTKGSSNNSNSSKLLDHYTDEHDEYQDIVAHAQQQQQQQQRNQQHTSQAQARQQQQAQQQSVDLESRVDSNIMRNRSSDDSSSHQEDDDFYEEEDLAPHVNSSWERILLSRNEEEEEEIVKKIRPLSMARDEATMQAHQTPSPHKNRGAAHGSRMADMMRLDTRSAPHAAAPAAEHPQIRQAPDEHIWRESLRRLSSRGVRLTAHGVQCDPKRIWLAFSNEDHSLTWQTEFPRNVQNQAGASSIVLMRGALHRVPLANVLYLDVGKKTSALQKTSALVPPSACFSLLTQQGSLDLQTNSKLERDAVVCALSYLLDHVHASDWRTLYQDTTSSRGGGSSTVSSSFPLSHAEI